MDNKKMKSSIWNSVPDLEGSNGALKALARNVANHLKLNRPEMKRVVAKVVAEHHGIGDVGDYKGYMYYVKPDRIDMTQLITQSKEAFDDMMEQQKQKKVLKGAFSANANKNKNLTRKSSTAVFEIENWGRKSLNGVIIDETHLPHGDKEILLAVNKKKKKPKMGNKTTVLVTDQKSQKKNVPVKGTVIKQSQDSVIKQTVIKRLHTKSHNRIPKKSNPVNSLPSGDSTNPITENEEYRLPAGSSYYPPVDKTNDLNFKKLLKRSKSKTSINRKQLERSRNYEKPWLVQRIKRNNNKIPSQIDDVRLVKCSSKKLIVQKPRTPVKVRPQQNGIKWQTPYQFQGGAGATRKSFNEGPNKFDLPKVKTVLKTKIKTKSKVKLSQAPQVVRKDMSQNRRSQLNKLIQARLMKDLLREEAIDEPERLEAGAIHSTPVKKRRNKKQIDTPIREEAAIEICNTKSISNQADQLSKTKPKMKVKSKVKTVKNIKRIPKKSIPSTMGSKKSAQIPAVLQNPSQIHSPIQKTKKATKRIRRVPVDSSLSSIGLMNKHNGTSTSILTPAKRHLTIAFMSKRLEDRNHRQISVPWK